MVAALGLADKLAGTTAVILSKAVTGTAVLQAEKPEERPPLTALADHLLHTVVAVVAAAVQDLKQAVRVAQAAVGLGQMVQMAQQELQTPEAVVAAQTVQLEQAVQAVRVL